MFTKASMMLYHMVQWDLLTTNDAQKVSLNYKKKNIYIFKILQEIEDQQLIYNAF